jgi:hypothetical protein
MRYRLMNNMLEYALYVKMHFETFCKGSLRSGNEYG